MRWMKCSLVVLLATTAVGACDDTTGGDNTGRADVFMAKAAVSSAAAVYAADYVASSMGIINLSQIDSLYFTVTSVSALKQSADTSENSGGWETIQLADSGGRRINLMNLSPTDSIRLARGDIEAGTYKNIRLTFDSITGRVILNEDVTVGTQTFLAGTAYPLRVPSGILKIQGVTFTVAEDSLSKVNLVFDAAQSVDRIVATGSGVLQISPVIHKR
jgi:hypothetical protein